MSEKTCKTVRLSFKYALAAMTVIVGVLFIWQVLDCYLSGLAAGKTLSIFTREEVSSRLSRISPAIWIWIVLILAAFIVCEVFPVKEKRQIMTDARYALMRLKKRIPESAEGEAESALSYVRREEKILKILWLCCAALGLAGIIYGIVYLAIPSHFPNKDVTAEVLKMAYNIFPWAIATFAVACGICVYEGISAKKQLPYAKKLAAGNKPQVKAHGELYNKIYKILHHKYFLLGVRIGVGCLGVAFVIAGIFNENMFRILEKAVNICMECIGLGGLG